MIRLWKPRRLLAWAAAALALTALVACVLFFFLFPVPSPPPLEGPYAVGTRTVEIPAKENIPRLLVQFWYPTDHPEAGKPSPWLPDPATAPKFPFHRIAHTIARARIGAPPASNNSAKLPVLFYEHSWTGHRAENIVQVESLASLGFVVIAIDHPGQAGRVRYADGTVVPTALTDSIDFATSKGVAAFEASAGTCLEQRIANVQRVKQALIENEIPEFKDRLQLDRLGVFGFSFGGTCALRLCARDPSFHAGANEDGLFLGDEMPRGPFLFFDQQMPAYLLHEATPDEDMGQALTRRAEAHVLAAMKQPSRYRQILDGTSHDSFNDRIFLSRYPRLAHAGKRPAEEVHRIVVRNLSDFFHRELGVSGPR